MTNERSLKPEVAELQATIARLQSELAELADVKAYATAPLRKRCAERRSLQATITRLTTENKRLKEITNFKDAVACVFDNLKFIAANTSSEEWSEQLESLAEDVIEYAPEYKKKWKDICELSHLLSQARSMVNGASDEWHNSVEKVLGRNYAEIIHEMKDELAALREELAASKKEAMYKHASLEAKAKALKAAEQWNAELSKLLFRVQGSCLFSIPEGVHNEIDIALKPAESVQELDLKYSRLQFELTKARELINHISGDYTGETKRRIDEILSYTQESDK